MELDLAFKDRILMAIRHKESSQSELAREIGKRIEGTCSPQAIQQWVSGATTSPRREHLRAAVEFLGVRYEWLAYARGPMRVADIAPTPSAPGADAEAAILAHEWDTALLAAMPDDARSHWRQKFPHPSGTADMSVAWASPGALVEVGLYTHSTSLIPNARQLLWRLAVARAILPGTTQRRTVLLLASLENWREVPERHVAALRAEAGVLGIEVIHVASPERAAQVLLGEEQARAVPAADELGLDVSSVL